MYIENTTERLLYLSYQLDRGDTAPETRRLAFLPGCHDVSVDEARVFQAHAPNKCFFDAGWIKFGEGSAPKIEQPTDKGKSIVRVDPRAFEALKKGNDSFSKKK